MLQFPPIPPWNSWHPLVIHFPIVLLLLSPIFILVSAILPAPKGRPYLIAALAILFMGTVSLFVAEATGGSAARIAVRSGYIDSVLDAHMRLASETTIAFSGLLAILFAIVMLPRMLRCPATRLTTTVMPASFLILYCAGILFVINTAHAGGRLVHQYGVHAVVQAEPEIPEIAPPVQSAKKGGKL